MVQTWNKRRTTLCCLLLGVITLAIFWPSIGHDFLTYDDQQYVTENPHVRAGLTWPGVVWAFQSGEASNWHPLTWLSHMLDCQLYGLKPAGHHLTNLFLHITNTLLLFLLLNRITGATWRSFFVTALFAWHPLHVESVAWVAERKDVLCAFFWLLTVWSYVWYVIQPCAARYLSTLALLALALMAKPMAVTLPFVLLLLDYWPLGRIHSWGSVNSNQLKKLPLPRLLLEKLPFFVLTGISCALTLWAQGAGDSIVPAAQLPLGQRLAHVLVAYVEYLGKAAVPWKLAVFYPYVPYPTAAVFGAGTLLALISVIAWKLRPSRPYLMVGWLWFLGTMVPVIGLVQVGDQAMADRYSYLPFIGLFLMLAWAARDLGGQGYVTKALGALILLAAANACNHQLRYWRNTRTLFTHAEQVTRGNYVAAAMLGSLNAQEGDFARATQYYSEALSYNPNFPEAHFYLGNTLDKQGRLDEAISEYETALRLRPRFEQAHIFLGIALAKQNRLDEALDHDLAALKINPSSAAAHNNLAKIYHARGQWDAALEHYSTAVKLEPTLAAGHNNLGVVLLQQGRPAEGAAQLKEALRLNPGNLETLYNLALALNQSGKWAEALDYWEKLARAKPEDANTFYQWGAALAHSDKIREAMARFAHALLLNQNFPDALNALAWILATDPHPEFRNGTEAVRLATQACELSSSRQPLFLLTQSAAYAEMGTFGDAVSAAQKACDLAAAAGQKDVSARCEKLLKIFQANQPYHENTNQGFAAR